MSPFGSVRFFALAAIAAFGFQTATPPLAAPAKELSSAASAKDLASAASAYVTHYEDALQYVVADELASQRVTNESGLLLQSRITRSEFFLTYLDTQNTWMSVRDVLDVDGMPVTDTPGIRTLMARAPLWQLGSVIAQKNSRYNIGNITRTFNEPTLALLVVTDRHRARFSFDRGKPGKNDPEHAAVTVTFNEKDTPTLISGSSGAAVYSRGELRIDPATGRIDQTRIELSLGSVKASIETTYGFDKKLQLWVPHVMTETYQESKFVHQTIICESAYSNYRRFDSSVTIR